MNTKGNMSNDQTQNLKNSNKVPDLYPGSFAAGLISVEYRVWLYVRNNMTKVIIDKYEFMNEKMGISMDNLYKKCDEVTAECIIDNNVQKSLRTKGLEEVEKNALSKFFTYTDLDYVAEYCYVDNKKIYTQSPTRKSHTKIL